MREVHVLKLIVKLNKQIDECFNIINVLIVIHLSFHRLIIVHYLDCDLKNDPGFIYVLLFLLDREQFKCFKHPEDPIFSFVTFPLFFNNG